MIGKIFIKGEIGSYEDEQGNLIKGVDLLDIVEAVKEQRTLGALSLDVEIDSLGGFCDVGFSIYDYLKTIPEIVTTNAVNQCASIATVIFFAGDKRIANCPLMIHNPWISGVKGDADHIQQAADEIKAEEDKLIKFYSEHTGLEKIALDALMKNETYIYPDTAFKLGFSTETPIQKINSAVAYKAVAKIKDNMSKEIKGFHDKLDKVLNFLKGNDKPKPKALMAVEQGGKSLDIMAPDGTDFEGIPVVGDMVMSEGKPAADGTYVLTELNISIDVMSGVIAAVNEIPMDSTQELEEAKQLIETLRAEKEQDKLALAESTKEIESLGAKFKDIETTLSVMKGNAEIPAAKNHFRKPDGERSLEEIRKEKQERKAIYKK